MSNAQWCQEASWVTTEKPPASLLQVICAHGTDSVPNKQDHVQTKWNFTCKMEAVKAQEKQRSLILTSLKFIEAALEITERRMNHHPVVEKKTSS